MAFRDTNVYVSYRVWQIWKFSRGNIEAGQPHVETVFAIVFAFISVIFEDSNSQVKGRKIVGITYDDVHARWLVKHWIQVQP